MSSQSLPDSHGRFGPFGGQFVPETLMAALAELESAYRASRRDRRFQEELRHYLREYAGRPTPLYHAKRLSAHLGRGIRVYLKREDLLHTGAHKINNTIGQGLLAKKMGKPRVIAETGAGQHGVATATVAALLGLTCDVYMGTEDMERQRLNVFRMRLLGAKVIPVTSGSRTLKDACNEAIRDWVTNVRTTHYILGSVVGPHPYPRMVRDFQLVIGQEARRQIRSAGGRLPDVVLACVGGGSNAMGMFHPFERDRKVRLIGVEARYASTLVRGTVGVLHGSKSYLLQDRNGQVMETHSISAGLDYPGVGPEHAYYKKTGRAVYDAVTDSEALAGFRLLARTEGILPALEAAHAIGFLPKLARRLKRGAVVLVCLSGRGDKDVETVARELHEPD